KKRLRRQPRKFVKFARARRRCLRQPVRSRRLLTPRSRNSAGKKFSSSPSGEREGLLRKKPPASGRGLSLDGREPEGSNHANATRGDDQVRIHPNSLVCVRRLAQHVAAPPDRLNVVLAARCIGELLAKLAD